MTIEKNAKTPDNRIARTIEQKEAYPGTMAEQLGEAYNEYFKNCQSEIESLKKRVEELEKENNDLKNIINNGENYGNCK